MDPKRRMLEPACVFAGTILRRCWSHQGIGAATGGIAKKRAATSIHAGVAPLNAGDVFFAPTDEVATDHPVVCYKHDAECYNHLPGKLPPASREATTRNQRRAFCYNRLHFLLLLAFFLLQLRLTAGGKHGDRGR